MALSPPFAVKVTIESGSAAREGFTFVNQFKIGRHPDCQLRVEHQDVSRYHVEAFFEAGHWWVQDLRSTNGTYVEGRRIDKLPLTGTTLIRLGLSGPLLKFDLIKQIASEPSFSASSTLSDYIGHYFSETAGGKAGRHTIMVRKAYAEMRKKQRWLYISIIGVVGVLLVLTSGYAIYKHRQVRLQQKLATDIFYHMKALELELAAVIDNTDTHPSPEAEKQIGIFRNKMGQLEENYNRFVDTLNVYRKAISDEERIILRLARRFGESEVIMPADFVEEVRVYIAKWKSTGRFERAIRRAKSRGYIPRIVQTLTSHDLPPQFFYLALQESNLNLNACGPPTRHGIAKGMWQFIPATAAKYGLKTGPLVNEPKPDSGDDRHHFGKSTLAAAKYLRDIYTTDAQASGLLVMASYNWGERRVVKLIRSMPLDPHDRNFWQLISKYRRRIPNETYDYVLSIFSAAVIGENPRLFGYDFDNPLAAVEVARLGNY